MEEATTVAEARAHLARRAFELILLDVMLPDGDGYTLCRTLRSEGVKTPVLMLTARTLEDDMVRGFEAGAQDYLGKPYRLRELLARVGALVRRGGRSARRRCCASRATGWTWAGARWRRPTGRRWS